MKELLNDYELASTVLCWSLQLILLLNLVTAPPALAGGVSDQIYLCFTLTRGD